MKLPTMLPLRRREDRLRAQKKQRDSSAWTSIAIWKHVPIVSYCALIAKDYAHSHQTQPFASLVPRLIRHFIAASPRYKMTDGSGYETNLPRRQPC